MSKHRLQLKSNKLSWKPPTKLLNNHYLYSMEIVRSWREQKVMLKTWFPILNDEDFLFEEGKKDSMLDKLADKLKKTREELELLFAELQRH